MNEATTIEAVAPAAPPPKKRTPIDNLLSREQQAIVRLNPTAEQTRGMIRALLLLIVPETMTTAEEIFQFCEENWVDPLALQTSFRPGMEVRVIRGPQSVMNDACIDNELIGKTGTIHEFRRDYGGCAYFRSGSLVNWCIPLTCLELVTPETITEDEDRNADITIDVTFTVKREVTEQHRLTESWSGFIDVPRTIARQGEQAVRDWIEANWQDTDLNLSQEEINNDYLSTNNYGRPTHFSWEDDDIRNTLNNLLEEEDTNE